MSVRKLKEKLDSRTAQELRNDADDVFAPPKPDVEFRRLGWDNVVIAVNVNAAPLENLVGTGRMENRKDPPGRGLLRISAAQRARSLFEDVEITGLRSPDLGSSGGGAPGSKNVSDHYLDCAKAIKRLEEGMSKPNFTLLRKVCFQDEWVWLGQGRKAEYHVIQRIHRALDQACVVFGLLQVKDVIERWGRR